MEKSIINAPEIKEAETGFSGAAILIVDDEKNILSSLNRLLRPQGYRVYLAESGQEGLNILEQTDIDLVISDMKMPGMDGAEFLGFVARKWPECIRMLLTGYADLASTVKAVNEGKIYKYLSKPWEESDFLISVTNALRYRFLETERERLLLLTKQQNEELTELNNNLEHRVRERTAELNQAMQKLEQANLQMRKNYLATVKTFSSIVELRGGPVTGKGRKAAEIAVSIAKNFNLTADNIQNVMIAGLLHELGKLGLTDEIIKMPYNTLSAEDKRKFNTYPVIGEAALMSLDSLHEASKLIRSHREYYNGSGFPDQLKQEDIPLGSRILTVVADYLSMVNGTFTKEQFSKSQIRDFIWFNRGKLYDPRVVEEFLKVLGDELQRKEPEFLPIKSSGLQEGMILAKDLVSEDGVLLLAEGHLVTESMIQRIQYFERSTESDVIIYILK